MYLMSRDVAYDIISRATLGFSVALGLPGTVALEPWTVLPRRRNKHNFGTHFLVLVGEEVENCRDSARYLRRELSSLYQKMKLGDITYLYFIFFFPRLKHQNVP